VSGNAENDAAALPAGPALSEPDSVIAKVSAQAREAGADALEHAGKVVDDARSRGASLAGDVKDQVMTAAEGHREVLAEQVGDVADAVHQAGEHFKGNQDWIARIVEAGATELGTLASTLRTNDLEGLMGKLQDLARRQPGIFMGAAMAAGFAAVRVGKIAAAGVSQADLPSMPEVLHEPK
jgi:uncharacterized protein YjbJ (UPF0337 family)